MKQSRLSYHVRRRRKLTTIRTGSRLSHKSSSAAGSFSALTLLTRSQTIAAAVDATPQWWLIAYQMFRVSGGVIFLPLWYYGFLPGFFALPAGIGDTLTGLFAIVAVVALWRDAPPSWIISPEIVGKQVQLLKEMFPESLVIGILWNAGSASTVVLAAFAEQAARSLGNPAVAKFLNVIIPPSVLARADKVID
jgi:hypothetical protein